MQISVTVMALRPRRRVFMNTDSLVAGGERAPCIRAASGPCNQISSASDPTSSAAIVQLKARSRAALDSQPRSACPITAHRPVEGRLMTPNTAATSATARSEEHTSELQSLMRISYAVFCLTKQKNKQHK